MDIELRNGNFIRVGGCQSKCVSFSDLNDLNAIFFDYDWGVGDDEDMEKDDNLMDFLDGVKVDS